MRRKNSGIVERHLGVIHLLCRRYWRYLPPRTRAWYDVDDMIADAVVHVVRVSRRFDAAKAREVTWVHHVTENRCRSILARHQAALRCDRETVWLSENVERRLPSPEDHARRGAAKLAVEDVLARGSEELRALVSLIFEGAPDASATRFAAYAAKDAAVVAEFREIAARHRVGFEDFALVLRYDVA